MKASELRIGNYIQRDMIIESVIGLNDSQIETVNSIDFLMDDKFEPISLTEEWLLKFGFENELPHFVKHNIALSKNMIRDGSGRFDGFYCVLTCRDLSERNYISLKYVHQLQNLYIALTGEEELTIK